MPSPIPQEQLESGLELAQAAGVVVSWSMYRGRRNTMVRRFVVNTSDGEAHLWTPQAVDVFGYAVELMREQVEHGTGADPLPHDL